MHKRITRVVSPGLSRVGRVFSIVCPTFFECQRVFAMSFPGPSHRVYQAVHMPGRLSTHSGSSVRLPTCAATAWWCRRWCQWWRFRKADGVICLRQLFQEHVSVDTRFRKVKLRQVLRRVTCDQRSRIPYRAQAFLTLLLSTVS